MAAARKQKPHETGDAKMKMAAIKSVESEDQLASVPSPAKALQNQLQAHYQPLSRRMSVMLISLLMAFAFIGGWLGGSGSIGFA